MRDGLQKLEIRLALVVLEEEGIFIVPYKPVVTRNPGFCGFIQKFVPFNRLFNSITAITTRKNIDYLFKPESQGICSCNNFFSNVILGSLHGESSFLVLCRQTFKHA